jgi:hypothetical protein
MRWTWTAFVVGTLGLAACGEKHTYVGKITRSGLPEAVPTELTLTKTGDAEGTMTFEGSGEVIELARCTYPIKVKLVDGSWSPDGCSFKTKLDRTEMEMNTRLVGRTEMTGGSMKLIVSMLGMPGGDVSFEFEGKEKK